MAETIQTGGTRRPGSARLGDVHFREPVPAPEGWDRLPWYGPGFIWIVASVGSGSVLFTPRVGSRYEYELLWAALLVMLLIWIVIREVGRYTLVSGRSILSGYRELPGPRGWAVWLIVLPQMIASAVIVAGIAGLVGSALMIAFPGAYLTYGIGAIALSCVLVVSGRYYWVEKAGTVMAGLLVVSAFGTAAVVSPDLAAGGRGLIPRVPADFDLYFIIPWLSFVVAGPAAVLWYSYWLLARGYGGPGQGGGAGTGGESTQEDEFAPKDESTQEDEFAQESWTASTELASEGSRAAPSGASDPEAAHESRERLRKWMRIMSTTAGIGVLGGGLVSIAFLVLGTELLAPEAVMPEGIAVAEDLSRLLADVWGAPGFWMLILGVVIALWGSILANQDGFGRLYADATLLMLPRRWIRRIAPGTDERRVRIRLQNVFTILVLAIVPVLIVLVARDPVWILSIGGILAAAHMPLIVLLTLQVNRTHLPAAHRPGPWAVAGTIVAAAFYGVVAVIYLIGLLPGLQA